MRHCILTALAVGLLLACGQADLSQDPNPPPPPVDSTAGIWVTSNLTSFTIDSVGIWNANNTRGGTTVIAQSGPRHFSVKADGAMRVYFVSAPGYNPSIASKTPVRGIDVDAIANFTPVSSTPDTTGLLRVISSPSGMSVELSYSLLDRDSLDSRVVTDTTLIRKPGFYKADCFDPNGVYAPVTAYQAVNAGQLSVVVCMMQKVTVPTGSHLGLDTVEILFPDPTITVNDPRNWLWGMAPRFSGPYVDSIPVQIEMLVKYTLAHDESFAIRMQLSGPPGSNTNWVGYVLKPGTTNPVVADIGGASGWKWVAVGGFVWPSGSSFNIWGFHGYLFDITNGIEGHLYSPTLPYGNVSFGGIRFKRTVRVP